MIITISGNAGSGKSTVAKIILKQLNAERIYVGGIRRELARKKGMTLEELNVYALDHPETDVDVDEKAAAQARELEKEGKIVIVEGRTMFHFIPESIKIYVKVDSLVGAKRIWQDLQKAELDLKRNQDKVNSLEELQEKTENRQKNDIVRYQKYYGVNPYDEKHYDLVVDSTTPSAVKVAKKVMEFIEKQQKNL